MDFVRDEAHVKRVLARLRSIDPERLPFKAKVARNKYINELEDELNVFTVNKGEVAIATLPLETN